MASVLIIDDHQGTLDTFSTVLRAAGHEAVTVATGQGGVALARSRHFDVLLVDLHLPDISGIDVVRLAKLSGVGGRIVIVTAFPSIESSFDAAQAGADGYVDGPLFDDDVVEVVAQAMSGALPVRHPANGRTLGSQTANSAANTVESKKSITDLVNRLAWPELTSRQFMAATVSLRAILKGPKPKDLSNRPHTTTRPFSQAATQIIERLESHLADRSVPRETDLAVELSITRVEIGRQLRLHTGAGFRQWRRALRVRPALSELALTNERVSQIAYLIGYQHVSQFDRDFSQAFGLTPRGYRSAVRRQSQMPSTPPKS